MKLKSVLLLLSVFVMVSCTSDKEEASKGWIVNDYSKEEMELLQLEVNEGHKPGLLDPIQVAREFFTSREGLMIDNSYPTKHVLDQEGTYILQYKLINGRYVQLELTQFSQSEDPSIYVVNRYRFTDQEGNVSKNIEFEE